MFGQRAHVGAQTGVGPIELGDLGGRAPRRVLPAGLGEELGAGVVEPVGEGEAGRAFGDQRPVPPPSTDHVPRRVEGDRSRAEVPDRPGPLGLDQPQQVQEVLRRVRGAGGEPPRLLVQRGQQLTAVVAVARGDLGGESQSAQQVEHRNRIETRGGRQQRRGRCRVPGQGGPVAEHRRADRAVDVREEQRDGIVGVLVGVDRLTGHEGALAAQHTRQPPVADEHLADVLAADPAHEGECRIHHLDVLVECRCAVEEVVRGRVVGVGGGGVTPGEQALAGTQRLVGGVLDRLEHPGQEIEPVPCL